MSGGIVRLLTIGTLGLLLAFGAMRGPGRSAAQDAATPGAEEVVGHPAHVHEGSCDDLGAVIAPLTPVTDLDDEGLGAAAEGNEDAVPVETSVSTVELTLDEMLADDHAINVHLSDEEIGEYIACGDIGGTRLPDGAIAIGLQELNESGHTGVAYLAPGATGVGTDISVFLAQDLAEDADGATGDDEATPEDEEDA